jgi:hypothetical protein
MLALAAATVAADPVSLRPRWTPGDERRYDLTAEYVQSSPDDQGHDAQRRVTQSARLLLHVTEVDAAGGATVRLTFESLHTERIEPGDESGETFDWTAPGDAPPAPDAEPSALLRLLRALAGCSMVAAVRPDGSVETVTGLLPLAEALKAAGGDTPALRGVGFFSPPRLKGNLAMLWSVDPERKPREPGAQWRTTEHLTLGEAYAADATTAWTLANLDESIAGITGARTLAPSPSRREADPAAPRLSIKDQQSAVAAEWDTAAGSLIHRADHLFATWAATVDLGPGAATPQVAAEARTTTRIEITLVK